MREPRCPTASSARRDRAGCRPGRCRSPGSWTRHPLASCGRACGPSPRRSRSPARIRPIAVAQPDEDRSRRSRKWPILSSRTCGERSPRAAAVSKVSPCPACTSMPAACASRAEALQTIQLGPPPVVGVVRRGSPRNRRPCAARPRGTPSPAATSILPRDSAATKRETRNPALCQIASPAAAAVRGLPRDVEPAFGGALLAPLGHDAGGVRANREARCRRISSVAAISKFSGRSISALAGGRCRRRGYGGGPRAGAR